MFLPAPLVLKGFIAYLEDHPVLSVIPNLRVVPNLKGFDGTSPLIRPRQSPSIDPDLRVRARSFDVNCYGGVYEDTLNLAELAQAAALDMKGHEAADFVVTDVTSGITPHDLSDELNGRYRFVFEVTIYVRRA